MRSKPVNTTKWLPPHKKSKKDMIPDEEPGMPSIQSVKASNTPRPSKAAALPQFQEGNIMISPSLDQKIDAALGYSVFHREDSSGMLDEMVRVTTSGLRFDSKIEFENYLTEGVLLNVNRMVSNYIGVPVGEYVIFNINNNKATLIPTADVTVQETDFVRTPKLYEIFRSQLAGCWDKTEKTISEDQDPNDSGWRKSLPGSGFGKKERVQSGKSKYPRNPKTKSAIEASGTDQEGLATACGVDPSSVSRWTAKSGKGSRVPSLKNAMCLAKHTGGDVESMFAGAEGPPTKSRTSTSGSGGGRNKAFRQGSPRS